MKKFFGILLIVAGSLWALAFLFTFSAADGASIFASTFLVGIGVIAIVIGSLLTKSKKKSDVQSVNAVPNQGYAPPQVEQTEKTQPQQQSTNLTQKEIRELTAKKINDFPSSLDSVSALELATIYNKFNDPKLPFEFKGSNQNGVDMVAHWRLADADYLGLLGLSKHDIQASFDVLMKFDEVNKVLRCKDKFYKKESSFGLGGMGMQMSTFSGKSKSLQKEIVFGRKKDGSVGKVVDISLDTTILQNAINDIAQKNGWEVKRVAGKL